MSHILHVQMVDCMPNSCGFGWSAARPGCRKIQLVPFDLFGRAKKNMSTCCGMHWSWRRKTQVKHAECENWPLPILFDPFLNSTSKILPQKNGVLRWISLISFKIFPAVRSASLPYETPFWDAWKRNQKTGEIFGNKPLGFQSWRRGMEQDDCKHHHKPYKPGHHSALHNIFEKTIPFW